MISRQPIRFGLLCLLGFCLAGLLPAPALEKQGMPDLAQIEQTCVPTAMANLIIWFGLHGYPKLIVNGDGPEDGYIHTVHKIMSCTDANFDLGTRPDMVVVGIRKYIEQAGYACDVDYHGLGRKAFNVDWLNENDSPNKGFVLLLTYCSHDTRNDTYSNAYKAGHAVTLFNELPGTLIVHDPAHDEDETGSKILTPQVLDHGTWVTDLGNVALTAPVAGLLMVSGSMMDAPPNAQIMLTGAVRITMHPANEPVASSSSSPAGGPDSSVAGNDAPAASPTQPPPMMSWTEWLLSWFSSK